MKLQSSTTSEKHGEVPPIHSTGFILRTVVFFVVLAMLSIFAGAFPGPLDPLSHRFFSLIIFPVAVISFGLGVWHGAGSHRRQRWGLYIAIVVLLVVAIIFAGFEIVRIAHLLG